MTYIENIFICLAIPILLSSLFIKGRVRSYTIFVITGMGICLLSAYVSSFFVGLSAVNSKTASIEITPVCEEVMKMLPLIFYFMIFEPDERELPAAAIAIAVGFATFENACYLTENGTENTFFLLIRGISAGALHILCGILAGYGISYVFSRRWLALTGTAGLLGACIGFHAIYNLLVTADGLWRISGYLFPSTLITVLFAAKRTIPKLNFYKKSVRGGTR